MFGLADALSRRSGRGSVNLTALWVGVGRNTPKINVIRLGYKASVEPVANMPILRDNTAKVTMSCET